MRKAVVVLVLLPVIVCCGCATDFASLAEHPDATGTYSWSRMTTGEAVGNIFLSLLGAMASAAVSAGAGQPVDAGPGVSFSPDGSRVPVALIFETITSGFVSGRTVGEMLDLVTFDVTRFPGKEIGWLAGPNLMVAGTADEVSDDVQVVVVMALRMGGKALRYNEVRILRRQGDEIWYHARPLCTADKKRFYDPTTSCFTTAFSSISAIVTGARSYYNANQGSMTFSRLGLGAAGAS